MPLQSSGAISLSDIATEFGDTSPHSLSEFYRGGARVPDSSSTANIPQSGAISLANFYGAASSFPFFIEYLVVAGGGGSSNGGGGGGGYRTNLSGETSGGGQGAEPSLVLMTGTSYTVTVGAGGAVGSNGGNSVFSNITSLGGGCSAAVGGSGGGVNGGTGYTAQVSAFPGTANQGYAGGTAIGDLAWYCERFPSREDCQMRHKPSGGGGAGGVGGNSEFYVYGVGGPGVTSSVTGPPITRAGGGGGIDGSGSGANGSGGGNTANLGGGGRGTNGGSGIVILRYPSTLTLSNPAGGLAITTTIFGANKVSEITAGTGTIIFG